MIKIEEVLSDIEGFFKKYPLGTYRLTSSVEAYITRLYKRFEKEIGYNLSLTIETNLNNFHKRKSLNEVKDANTLELKDKTYILKIKKIDNIN
ncbi:MAG: hypothetical protein AABW81_04375 [Nanoarchaeota archaeon]